LNTAYGSEAIQIAALRIPDLVLMDIKLPDINGYDATRIIRQQNPNLKIIAQTANAGIEDRQKAMDAGCVDYISKPILYDALLSTINRHIT